MTGLGQLDYVASCRSSTAESASDVSLSHLFHLLSSTCRVVLFVCVLFFGWCLGCFVCVVCFPCFASARGLFLIFNENAR